MHSRISRRRVLATGTAAAGAFIGSYGAHSYAKTLPQTFGQDFLMPWSPDVTEKRDLTPGKTPIRLSCNAYCIHYSKGMNIPDKVKMVRDKGYTAAEANDNWKNAADSEIRELHDALKEHDVLLYTIQSASTTSIPICPSAKRSTSGSPRMWKLRTGSASSSS